MIKKLKNFFSKKKKIVEKNYIPLRVAGISYSKMANIYILILEEVIPTWNDLTKPPPSARRVPVVVSFFEAQVIMVEIEKMRPQVLLIYDVIKEFSNAFKFKFKNVVIDSISDSEVFSKMICDNKEQTEVQIRPSDAVAISLRLKIPIVIEDNLLTTINNMLNEKYDVKRMSEMEKLENYSIQDLKNILQDAIDREDYENASLIRDEIAKKSQVE